MKHIKLNNEVEFPIIGSGTNTYGKEVNKYSAGLGGGTKVVDWVIESDYRHFDSARLYNSEEVVGNGLTKSSVPREEFFITTKLKTMDGYKDADSAHAKIEKSLEILQTDYFDEFLIDSPWNDHDEIMETWGFWKITTNVVRSNQSTCPTLSRTVLT